MHYFTLEISQMCLISDCGPGCSTIQGSDTPWQFNATHIDASRQCILNITETFSSNALRVALWLDSADVSVHVRRCSRFKQNNINAFKYYRKQLTY